MKKKRILISVKQEHIDKGCKEDSKTCPVARAILDRLKGKICDLDAYTYTVNFRLISTMEVRIIGFPRSVWRFITAFDKGDEVTPFNFYLTVPEYIYNELH